MVKRHWGYDAFRPLQLEAMTAALQGRDSLAVLPTGGGKSLCYQAPALLADKPTVVVSPLIALMKDQVDALIQRGIDSAFLNSSLEPADRRLVIDGIRQGAFKLIFVAPERFAGDGFFGMLEQAGVGAFAIDEAHCISHWGHDFRSDYRRLGQLKQRFGGASIHAFTATATDRVRQDIVAQLGLRDPAVLVGDFFRPNLTYRLVRRGPGFGDALDAVRDRPGKGGIVYCIRRADVDELTAMLRVAGVKAIGYHAGMSGDERTQAQDAFAAGRVDVVVATVAFGMGIDRADIRYVIHAAMPKSTEHYQQETGRAGRDGDPAECLLFYSGADFRLWQTIIEKGDPNAENRAEQVHRLSEMYRFCTGATCRHRRLVTYFGQAWDRDNCGACDLCLGTIPTVPGSTVIAQKILSCVARTDQRYGAAYVVDVLRGEATDRIIAQGHDKLSTFGLVPDQPKAGLMAWIDQLVDQDVLLRTDEYRVLKLTEKGLAVLRSEAEAKLYDVSARRRSTKRSRRARAKPEKPPAKRASTVGRGRTGPAAVAADASHPTADPLRRAAETAEHHDPEAVVLFGKLRELRRMIADERKVPAYKVFSDKTLREMAHARPVHTEAFLAIGGVGPGKYKEFGRLFIDAIRSHAGLSDPVGEGLPARELECDYAETQAPPPATDEALEPGADQDLDPGDELLFEKLRALRKTIAEERNVAPFVVFWNRTLRNIVRARPTTRDDMLAVSGVGAVKYDLYGQRFIDAVKSHLRQ